MILPFHMMNQQRAAAIIASASEDPSITITTTKNGTFSSTWKGSGTITVDWGEGGATEDFVLTAGGVSVSHAYGDASEKTITVTNALSGVTSLVGDSTSTNAVTGLNSLTACTFMTWYFNSITDLSGFAGMPVIDELGLAFNSSLADISPLSGLTSLTRLSLHQCNISNLSPLSTLTALKYLRLYNNAFSDISPLTSLTDLSIGLHVYNNNITYTTLTWPTYTAGTLRFDSAGLSSAEVDQLLIDAAAANWATLNLYIGGSNGARTGASDAAYATLVANGVNFL